MTADPDITVPCDLCAHTFPDVTALADHIAIAHGIEPDGP